MTRHVVLVGAGLAHLHVLREWRRRPLPDVQLTIVSPPEHFLSGMVPGYLRGTYEASALRLDVAALARHAGAAHVSALAERVLASRGTVDAGTESLSFDVCSLDVGAGVGGAEIPGVREHAIPLRPASRAVELRARLDASIAARQPFGVVVVGAGVAGIEAAFAIRRRITDAGAPGTVTIADAGPVPLPGEPVGMRGRLLDALRERGIGVVLGGAVTRVGERELQLASGASLPAALVVWTASAAAPRLLAASGLPRTDDGFLRVDRTLRAVGLTSLFGVGDCARIEGAHLVAHPLGQGPVLLHNLRAALGDGRPKRYRPRSRALTLVDTGDGRAMARWGALHAGGAWAWRLRQGRDGQAAKEFRAGSDERPVPRS